MPPAEQNQVAERRRPALRPVLDVVPIASRRPAPGEAAVPVAGRQRPAQGGRDGARAAADVQDLTGRSVPHRHGRGVAGQPAGRFRGDVDAARFIEGRLAPGGGREDRAAGPRRLGSAGHGPERQY